MGHWGHSASYHSVGGLRGVARLIWGAHMGLLFHSGSLSSFVVCLGRSVHLGRRLGVVGSFAVVRFIRGVPRCRRVHSRSLGSFKGSIGVVGYIGVFRFFGGRLRVILFIRGRSVHSCGI